MTLIKSFWNDRSGAAAAEYALILAIVGSAIAVAAVALGGAVAGEMQQAAGLVSAAIP
ncbi:MAG TPA: Flp family type IVb pilin [Sphingobium sp.]|nr:Flp family type IVb pilin [Sphingobium sp.]